MTNFLFYCLIFLSPFITTFGFVNQTDEFFRLKIVLFLVEALFILFILVKKEKKQFKKSQFYFFSSLILIISTLLYLLPFSPDAFFGNLARLQGIFWYWHLFIFLFLASFFKPTFRLNWLKFIFLPLLLIISLLFEVNLAGRLVGPLGEPNALAAIALFYYHFYIFNHRFYIKILGFCQILLLLFLSKSDSAFLALALHSFYLVMLNFLKIKQQIAIFIVVSLLFVALPITFFLDRTEVFENRSEIWQTAVMAIKQKPFFGHGYARIAEVLKNQSQNSPKTNTLKFQYVDSTHNLFLDYLIQGGWFSLMILIALLVVFFYRNIQLKASGDLSLMICLLTVLFFNPMSVSVYLIFFFLLAGNNLIKIEK